MKTIFLFCILFFGFNSYGQKDSVAKYLKEEWKKVEIGNGFSIDCPFDLEEDDLSGELSEDVKKLIDKMSTFNLSGKYGLDDAFSIYISTITYVPSVTANLEGSLNGAKSNLAAIENVKDLVCDRTDVNEFGLNGAKLNCNFLNADVPFTVESYTYEKGNKLWTIVVVYKQEDRENGKEFMRRLHDSIKLSVL